MKIKISIGLLLAVHTSFGQIQVATQHNNLARTGWNNQETILHTHNVARKSFGLLFTRPVDDQIYAQPLVISKVPIGGGTHNIVLVATVNNTLYAFDADNIGTSTPYWERNITPSGGRPPKNSDMTGACGGFYFDFSGNMGIVGTPVIDTVSQTMYVVARDLSAGVHHQMLHAIDIKSGAERPNSPVNISAAVSGNGNGSNAGTIAFNSQKQNQRPGLMLLNGIVYIGFSSHCDWGPYHGWLLGYDATTLAQKIVYNNTPEGDEAGIWMSGAGPSADELGNIYIATGNGTVGTGGNPGNVINRGESALRLNVSGSTLSVKSFFTPSNYPALEASDLDFGVTAMMLIPNSNFVITGSKDGYLFLMDRTNLGGYSVSSNNVQQVINVGRNKYLRSSLAYYKGAAQEFVYSWSENSPLMAMPFNRISNQFDVPNILFGGATGPVGNNGAFLSVSSHASIDSTAILWTWYASSGDANHDVRPGILRAFDATDVRKELWNSSMDASDYPGNYAKFVNPTIANGKVYLGTFSNRLAVFGLMNKTITGVEMQPDHYPRVYPNPATEKIVVQPGKDRITSVSLLDLSGRTIRSEFPPESSADISLPIADLPKGLYIVEITTPSGTYRLKVLH
jgi:hypothetical protein